MFYNGILAAACRISSTNWDILWALYWFIQMQIQQLPAGGEVVSHLTLAMFTEMCVVVRAGRWDVYKPLSLSRLWHGCSNKWETKICCFVIGWQTITAGGPSGGGASYRRCQVYVSCCRLSCFYLRHKKTEFMFLTLITSGGHEWVMSTNIMENESFF